MPQDHDVVIVGSGSTAFAAALRAQTLGAKVLMIEKSALGGTCVNWGCIPSKTLIHSALFCQEARLGARIGLGLTESEIDFSALMANKGRVVQHLSQTKYLNILRDVPGLTLLKGTGRFLGPHILEVGGKIVTGEKILIATGGNPRVVEFPGLQGVNYLTSRSALLLKKFPGSLVIIGGGAIALELGQMFHRLGTSVTILEHGSRILPGLEAEPALALQQALVDEGMEIIPNVAICSVQKVADLTLVNAEVNGRQRQFAAERLLLAIGTAPASAGIGLEQAGVEVDDKGFIKVNERMRTTTQGIWAAGDVIGGMMIATVGAREGIVAVDDMFNPGCGCQMDYLSTPMAIFTDPELGTVGYTEQAARAAGFTVITSSLPVSNIPKAHVTGSLTGIIKMVADKASGRLLGVHLVCHRGAELINEAALAVRMRITIEEMANTLHVYPSMGEGLRLCAQGFSRDIRKLSCCAE
ncbi:MAG TPA: mercury(II) reductase [Geobacteraceae bacterium]|nr:mercury(II) reductase [Geobacteraceae bacterium]